MALTDARFERGGFPERTQRDDEVSKVYFLEKDHILLKLKIYFFALFLIQTQEKVCYYLV